MTEDFNTRNNNWDPAFPHYLTHTNTLRDVADSFDLELSVPINQVSTWYADKFQDANSVLDLIFFCTNAKKFVNYSISTDFW